jgi:GGDEF domain-containing protein
VLEEHNSAAVRPYELAMSMGVAHPLADGPVGLDQLLADADARMYEVKSAAR